MNADRKSDGPVVPAKPPNNAGFEGQVAESVEGSGPAKGDAASKTRHGLRAGEGGSSALDRVRERAREDKEARFTALLHRITPELLGQAYRAINPKAAAGVDGVTWEAYGQELEDNLRDLHGRLHGGSYRAKSARRSEIPKPDGRVRPLAIAALEDKILQRATVEVLSVVYEQDFLRCSYGFRPDRSAHEVLDALAVGITRKKVDWVLDADLWEAFTSLESFLSGALPRTPDRGPTDPTVDLEMARRGSGPGSPQPRERGSRLSCLESRPDKPQHPPDQSRVRPPRSRTMVASARARQSRQPRETGVLATQWRLVRCFLARQPIRNYAAYLCTTYDVKTSVGTAWSSDLRPPTSHRAPDRRRKCEGDREGQ